MSYFFHIISLVVVFASPTVELHISLNINMKMKSKKTEDFISRRKPEITHYVNTRTLLSLERSLNTASAGGGF